MPTIELTAIDELMDLVVTTKGSEDLGVGFVASSCCCCCSLCCCSCNGGNQTSQEA